MEANDILLDTNADVAFTQGKLVERPMPTNDVWIADSALQHGLGLFSYDRHFQAIEGLRVGTKLADFTV